MQIELEVVVTVEGTELQMQDRLVVLGPRRVSPHERGDRAGEQDETA